MRSLRVLIRPALAGLVLVLPGVAQAPASDAIAWRTPAADGASLARTPAGVQAELDRALARGDGAHLVVQLERAPRALLEARLAAVGLELLSPLGDGAWFAAIDAERLDAGALASLPALAGLADVRREWKLDPRIAAGDLPPWSLVDAEPDPTVAVYVLFHEDVALPDAAARAQADGARVVDVLASVNGLVLELPESALETLAARDAVRWIEPPLPRMEGIKNDANRALTEADVVQAPPFSLDGSGVTVLVYDAGTALETHVDFGGRLTARDTSGTINHATHVSATIGGSGAASGGTFAGMAPGVTLESYGFETDGTSIFLYTNPGDIEADYGEALNVFGATIANNSIGTNTETNGFPCNIQGDYGVTSALIDSIVRGGLGSPMRIVWANGNERQGSFCDLEGFGDYYSTAPPATAKNHITVGALNANNDSMTSFSSWGPTDDGRLKPDISAPGCQSDGDFGVTSAGSSNDTDLSTLCGTSMASPTVCGIGALMIEDWRAQFGGPDPSGAMLKALLAQSAADNGNPGPDYQFGYGSVRATDAIALLRTGEHREDEVADQGARVVYTVTVPTAGPELALTLAWDDVPGAPNVAGALVNDLDLRVFDPGGARHFPWTLDPAAPAASAVRDAENHLDNIEQVRVDAAAAGAWRVEVAGFDVPAGPQPFALVSSHAITDGPYVDIGFATPLPASIEPGTPTLVTARVEPVGEALVGSPKLEFRFDGGAFSSVTMSPVGGDLFEALVPAAACGDVPELFVSAEGTLSGEATNPPDAPATLVTFAVEQQAVLFADDFETDLGWTVENVAVADGPWERDVPAGDGGRNDPLFDFDGSGACWLTDNVAGNSDVDGGPTRLLSPVLDLSGAAGDVIVRFGAWFANDDFDADAMDVEVSDDAGGSWTLVETLDNTSGWTLREFRLQDFVAPTNAVQVRYSVTDNPNDSITEAAIDAFAVLDVTCDDAVKPPAGLTYGTGSAGSLGVPTMLAFGQLQSGTPLCLVGGNVPAGTSTFLAFATAPEIPPVFGNNGVVLNVSAPFAGIVPLVADGDGEVVIETTLTPAASGVSVFFQLFAQDGVGGADFASSQGLQLDIP